MGAGRTDQTAERVHRAALPGHDVPARAGGDAAGGHGGRGARRVRQRLSARADPAGAARGRRPRAAAGARGQGEDPGAQPRGAAQAAVVDHHK